MKKNHYVKAMSLAVVAATSFAVVACDNDTLSGPDFNAGNGGTSSAVEQLEPQSSSSEVAVSSSSDIPLSSQCAALLPECGYTVEQLCEMGETYFCVSSSSFSPKPLSSSSVETCPNGRWTTSCNGVETYEPICCTESSFKTCKHISDYDGMTEQGNCVGQNGLTAVDCETEANYECKDNYWKPVACLNIKPSECKPGMGGCGYTLCQPKGIREIADCETSVKYYCDGEIWQVNGNADNKRCAQGELEYCEACFNIGAINGHYKCEKGKWKKFGMGDETCLHISDIKCDDNRPGCGFCGVEKRFAFDCETGEEFVCDQGYWSLNVKDCEPGMDGCAVPVCNALAPECGYSEYELCNKYGIDRYCNDKWLSEPCDGSESSRDLRIVESNNSFRIENYICVNNKWVERFKYYECGEEVDCDRPSLRCQASPVIGTACENEGESSEIDGCVFFCSAGRFLYAPAPW